MALYIALLRKEPKSDYSVDFPDFPGCITAGKTLEEAHQFAAEALAFHIGGMEKDGDAIPAPSALDTVRLHREHRDAVPFLVEVAPSSRVERINITMPARILEIIDTYANEIGMSRSAFLAHAAKRELGLTGAARPPKLGKISHPPRKKAGFRTKRRTGARARARA